MNVALWIVQGLLAANFLFAAGLKLFAFNMMAANSPGTENMHGMFIIIALCEVAGAIGLIAPRLTGILPVLTPWAAAALATVSLLACGFHIARSEFGETIPAIVLFVLCVFVAWGRAAQANPSVIRDKHSLEKGSR